MAIRTLSEIQQEGINPSAPRGKTLLEIMAQAKSLEQDSWSTVLVSSSKMAGINLGKMATNVTGMLLDTKDPITQAGEDTYRFLQNTFADRIANPTEKPYYKNEFTKLHERANNYIKDKVNDTSVYLDELAKEVQETRTGETFKGGFFDNLTYEKGFKRATSLLIENMPQFGFALGAGAITKNPKVAAIALSLGDGSEAYEEGKKMLSDKNLFVQALGKDRAAAALGWARSLGSYGILKALGPIDKILKGQIISGILTEAPEEVLQTWWGNLVAKVGYDDARDIFIGTGDALVAGAVTGGFASTTASMFQQHKNSEVKQRAEKIESLIQQGKITQEDIMGIFDAVNQEIFDTHRDVVDMSMDELTSRMAEVSNLGTEYGEIVKLREQEQATPTQQTVELEFEEKVMPEMTADQREDLFYKRVQMKGKVNEAVNNLYSAVTEAKLIQKTIDVLEKQGKSTKAMESKLKKAEESVDSLQNEITNMTIELSNVGLQIPKSIHNARMLATKITGDIRLKAKDVDTIAKRSLEQQRKQFLKGVFQGGKRAEAARKELTRSIKKFINESGVESKEYTKNLTTAMMNAANETNPLKAAEKLNKAINIIEGRRNRNKARDIVKKTKKSIGGDQALKDTIAKNKELEVSEEQQEFLNRMLEEKNPSIDDANRFNFLVNQIKNYDSLTELGIRIDRANYIQKAIERIEKFDGKRVESTVSQYIRESGIKSNLKRTVKNYVLDQIRPELLYKIIGVKEIFDDMKLSESKFQENQANFMSFFNRAFKDMDVDSLHQKVNIPDLGSEFDGMTLDMAYFVYANAFNDKNQAVLLNSGMTEEDIAAIVNWVEQNHGSFVEGMEKLWNYYEVNQQPRLNDAVLKTEGRSIGKRNRYFQIKNLESEGYKDPMDALNGSTFEPATVNKDFTKTAFGTDRAFTRFSFVNTALSTGMKVENYIAKANTIANARKVLMDRSFRNAITDRLGSHALDILDKHLIDYARNGSLKTENFIEKLSDTIRQNFPITVLGANLTVSLRQTVSLINAYNMLEPSSVNNSVVQALQNPLEIIKFANKNSLIVKNRSQNLQREYLEAVRRGDIVQASRGLAKTQEILTKTAEVSMMPIQVLDKFTVSVVFKAAYDQAIKTQSHADAVKFAEYVITRTQPFGSALYLPHLHRGNVLARMYTMFTNQVNQNANLILERWYDTTGNTEQSLDEVFGQEYNGQEGKKISKKNRLAMTVINISVGQAFLLMLMSYGFRVPEKEETVALNMATTSLGMLSGLSNIMPLISIGDFVSTSPIDGFYRDMAKALKGDERAMLNVSGVVFRLPTTGARKIVTGDIFLDPSDKAKKNAKSTLGTVELSEYLDDKIDFETLLGD